MAVKPLLNFEIHGAKELYNTLLKMEQKTQERILRRTIRLSMQPLRDSLGIAIVSRLTTMNARSRAFYAKQLRVVTKINRRNGSIKAYVITSRKELIKEINAIKKTGDLESANALNEIRGFGQLAHLYEAGVKPHKIKQLGGRRVLNHPGIKGIPLYQQTFESKAPASAKKFISIMGDELQREFKRQARLKLKASK